MPIATIPTADQDTAAMLSKARRLHRRTLSLWARSLLALGQRQGARRITADPYVSPQLAAYRQARRTHRHMARTSRRANRSK